MGVMKAMEEATAEMKKATDGTMKVAEAVLADVKSVQAAKTATAEEVTMEGGPPGLTPPALWWNQMRARELKAKEVLGGVSATAPSHDHGVPLTHTEKTKVAKTLMQMHSRLEKEGTMLGLEGLSAEVLIDTAKTVVELMQKGGQEVPPGLTFQGAKTLPRGNIVFTANSPAGGVWIREHRLAFIRNLGGVAKIADAVIFVALENVPVGFCVTERALRGLENTNELPKGSINSA
ncbi:hypothetical protein FIBSPDRAFT_900296 [Athelia psychrophila]|uniref:Uncharacterized protein n=1 Tax=Athelia psychrophila TaxID=1759441 RepID=A0A165YLN8_9AGAM|nr:hypothetical protein FIBSPDRAFT_900296 [Fibularhizoctonia sp. CBS 109695]